jgi:hypothetical protein
LCNRRPNRLRRDGGGGNKNFQLVVTDKIPNSEIFAARRLFRVRANLKNSNII